MINTQFIGKNLKHLRLYLDLTGQELADLVGQTRQSISKMEKTGKVTKLTATALRYVLKYKAIEEGKDPEIIERAFEEPLL